jgi:phosphate-selective porin OprO/OprP
MRLLQLFLMLCSIGPFLARSQYAVQDTNRLMQDIPKAFSEVPYFTFGQGIGIFPADSLFSLNLRFRMQNRAGIAFDRAGVEEVEARVRRLRLRFDGFVLTPRISYIIQLSFTRGDMDWENTEFPNVLRDAMIFYQITPKVQLGFGQTKLPGNRQRVNSSGDLQFVDRSIANARLNIDRDFGAQVAYTEKLFRDFHGVFRAALTTGEGRNITATTDGLAYTGRIELLPFGRFERFGDYFEGDLMRERKPKLSSGFTYSHNRQTMRTGGQIGALLFEPRDMTTLASDWLFKFRGFAAAFEWLYRTAPEPITTNEFGDFSYVFTGLGQNYQMSYVWPSNYELALRYSSMTPGSQIAGLEPNIRHYTLGCSRYMRGHRLKLQADLTYEQRMAIPQRPAGNNWMLRFQVEIGI